MGSYRKYDSEIKEMIIETRNPVLFPEIGIPRTTALYWIKNASKERKKTAYKESRKKQKEVVANKLRQERFKLFILSEVIKKNLKSAEKKGRALIIEYFDTAKKEFCIRLCTNVSSDSDTCGYIQAIENRYSRLHL